MLKKREVKIFVNILGNIILGALGVWILTSPWMSLMLWNYGDILFIIKAILGLLFSIVLAIYLGNTKSKLLYFLVGYSINIITYIIFFAYFVGRGLGPINGY